MKNVPSAHNHVARPSLSALILHIATYRPGHALLRFAMDLLFHNRALLVGLLSKAYFDALDATSPRVGLAALPLAALVALLALEGLAEVGITVARLAVGGSLGFRTVALLWYNTLARILELPGARALQSGAWAADGASVGEVLSTLRDDVWELEGVSVLPFDLAVTLLQLSLALLTLFAVDAQITLWMLLLLVLVWGTGYAMRGRAERLRAASRAASAAYSGALGEVLTLAQAIQVAAAQESAVAHLRRRGAARQEAELREELYQGLLDLFSYGWLDMLMSALLLAAGRKMLAGTFSVGDLSLFVVILADLGEWMGKGVHALVGIRLGRVSLRRTLALMQGAPPERLVEHSPMPLRKAPPPQPSPRRPKRSQREGAGTPLETLQVEGLTVRHPGVASAGIEGVSFELARGTLTVVAGRIGSGKSTLLRALLGLLPLDGGEIRWNGQCVDDPATFMQPPRAGYTPQVPGLLSATLRENVLLDWPATDAELDRAVRAAVLERDVAEFPEGLDTLIGVRGRRLSGGQAQRTALARMLVRRPELLVMDDVSSALDVETERLLWQRLLGRGAVIAPGGGHLASTGGHLAPAGREDPAPTGHAPTFLVVSHRRAVLERADQILLLEEGRIADRGTLQELLAHSPEMRRLCAFDV